MKAPLGNGELSIGIREDKSEMVGFQFNLNVDHKLAATVVRIPLITSLQLLPLGNGSLDVERTALETTEGWKHQTSLPKE